MQNDVMRQTGVGHSRIRRLIDILDGKPTVGKGQSLVEIALTMPVMLMLLLGLIEVGFMAGAYLTMLDGVREAARQGTTLNTTFWNDADTRRFHRMDCDTSDVTFNLSDEDTPNQNRRVPRNQAILGAPPYNYTVGSDGGFGFFDAVACRVIFSISPMLFEDDQVWPGDGTVAPSSERARLFTKNDIVVSAFSFTTIDFSDPAFEPSKIGTIVRDLPPERGGRYIMVTGRYPLSNRFCVTDESPIRGDNRDPFDFMHPNYYSDWHEGPSAVDSFGTISERTGLLGRNISDSQGIRGFVFTGQAIGTEDTSGTGNANKLCLGSRFTVQDVEYRLNQTVPANQLPTFRYSPSGGAVLVEYSWQYHPWFFGAILNFATGEPLFGPDQPGPEDDPVFYVYSFFPAPGAQGTPTPQQ